MKISVKITILACSLCTLAGFATGWVRAYDAATINNLNRSRDALLDQRNYLQQQADVVNKKIDSLQKQLDVINSYLRDNDRALRDVEVALNRG